MAKTFEALVKAQKENLITLEETKVFDIKNKPKPKHKRSLPVSFKALPQLVEEYHRMKQTLLSISSEEKIRALLFSSSTKGEGTSTALTNFAITLASGGDKVLLVDANHRNPSLHDLLNVEQRSGLTELLLEKP